MDSENDEEDLIYDNAEYTGPPVSVFVACPDTGTWPELHEYSEFRDGMCRMTSFARVVPNDAPLANVFSGFDAATLNRMFILNGRLVLSPSNPLWTQGLEGGGSICAAFNRLNLPRISQSLVKVSVTCPDTGTWPCRAEYTEFADEMHKLPTFVSILPNDSPLSDVFKNFAQDSVHRLFITRNGMVLEPGMSLSEQGMPDGGDICAVFDRAKMFVDALMIHPGRPVVPNRAVQFSTDLSASSPHNLLAWNNWMFGGSS
eukprot:737614_1